ncbi:uncharacterized protein [Eurosta solidaginis]|uniref:uncharacterized protein isoform X2 n=1 Tax=Eurosta solidaginis TaxID=178769 RepID=UPI0035312ACB
MNILTTCHKVYDRVSFKDKSLTEISRKKVNNAKDYTDIDQTVLEPSPQRIRNILTLEERVAAIEAYDCRPMYTKVAKMFNCSWEQIKNIIANRDAIMEFYVATRATESHIDPRGCEARSRKISFLGECLYEYIQRAQFHLKTNITEELLRMKAIEFRDIIQIDNFMPNKAWINHFKAEYNFSLSNRQITITRTPPTSLDLKDIMTYCTRNKGKLEEMPQPATVPIIPANRESSDLYRTTTRISVSDDNEAAMQEIKQRRLRKMNFLTKALYEYANRAKYHQKMRMCESALRKVAFDLKEMLKIDNFYPDKGWLHHFINVTYPNMLDESPILTGPPPLSLDLKDILSYCGRQEHKKQASSTITLKPKEQTVVTKAAIAATPPATVIQTPLVQIHTFNLRRNDESATLTTRSSPQASATCVKPIVACKIKDEVIELDAAIAECKDKQARMKVEQEEERDVKPNLNELLASSKTPAAPAKSNEAPVPKPIITTGSTKPPATVTLKKSDEQQKSTNVTNDSSACPLRVVSLSELVPSPSPAPAPTVIPTAIELSRSTIVPTKTTLSTTTIIQTKTTLPTAKIISTTPPLPTSLTLPTTTTVLPTKSTLVTVNATHVSRASPPGATRTAAAISTAIKSTSLTTPCSKQKRRSSDSIFPHQPLKLQKMENVSDQVVQTAHSPGHWSEHSDPDDEQLPKHVTNYKDALKLLKPLEEFAMLEENYRVIGLISQLEDIFKHPPKKADS